MAERRAPAPAQSPPDGGERPRQRGRETALVVLLLAALTVLLTWPAPALLGSAVTDLGDPILTTWILAWDVHALGAAPLRLFDANMFHPRRRTLAYTEHLLGLVPLVWPIRLLGAESLLAHNVVWLATFPLTGLALFWLVRHLTGHAGAAAVAAVLYAFSHARFGQLSHVQILSHQWLPLMLLGLHRSAEHGGRWRDVALAGGAFALQALSSGYQAFFAAIAGALFVAWLALPTTRPPLGRLIGRRTLAGALVALLLLPFFLPYGFVRAEIGLSRSLDEVAKHAARPASYLRAAPVNRWLGDMPAQFRADEAALFPGVVALALALPGAILAWRRRPATAGGSAARGHRWLAALDVALAGIVLVTVANWLLLGGFLSGSDRSGCRSETSVCLPLARPDPGRAPAPQRGPVPVRGLGWLRRIGWPNHAGYYVGLTCRRDRLVRTWLEIGQALRIHPVYRQLYGLVPGFDALRVPGRFGVLVMTGLAVLAGFGAAALAGGFPAPDGAEGRWAGSARWRSWRPGPCRCR